MRLLSATMFALMFSLLLSPAADAARFGGGVSIGKSFHMQKRVSPMTSPSARPSTAQRPNSAPNQRRPGLMGMFGGLLAGTMLGALLFGGGFHGISFVDIIILVVLGFILVKVFKGLGRKSSNAGYQRTATQPDFGNHNGHSTGGNEWGAQPQARQAERAPMFGAGSGAENIRVRTPDWFNESAFLSQATEHFRHLQKAWDTNDWREIETYVEPELLGSLKSQRAVQSEQQTTQVDSVMADLVGFNEEADQFTVSIHFTGWIRENANGPAVELSEIWHLTRSKTDANANWFIAGIEQPQ